MPKMLYATFEKDPVTGELVEILNDVTPQATHTDDGMIGGFDRFSAVDTPDIKVWITDDIKKLCTPPVDSLQDYRGRLHDVLWMAVNAMRRFIASNNGKLEFRHPLELKSTNFKVLIGRRYYEMRVDVDPGANFVIGLPVKF